jgi:D-glycero-alpha-D-manno-heptose-7-phosphate kinase
MTVNKYAYNTALGLSDVVDFRYGVIYSPVEAANDHADINHPVIRAEVRYCEIDRSLALSVLADLPPRSGRGSSSTFTAGYVNLLAHLQKRPIGKLDLAWDAVPIERNVLGESLGVQDRPRAYFCRRLAVQGAWLASCDTTTVMTMSRGRLSPSYGPAGSRAQDESDLG